MNSPAGLQTPSPVQLAHTIDEKEVMNGDLERQAARQAGGNDVLAVWESGPKNPRNWSSRKKWFTILIVALYTFVTPLGSSMMAPALPQIAEHFSISSPSVTALTLSIFLLTFAFGPLIFAPLSECYGRTWVFHLTNLAYMAFNLGCAFAPTTGALLGFRLLCGFFGSAAIACGGGSVADLYAPAERGSAMAVYSLGPLLAPSLGPVMGGFIAESIGYKYIFVVIAALCGICSIFAVPLLQETYAPVLKYRLSVQESSGLDADEQRKIHPTFVYGSLWRFLWVNLKRPLIILSTSLICFALSLYLAYMYGIYYIMFTTFPDLFGEVYGFSIGISGLTYIGIGLGFTAATIVGARGGNWVYQTLAARNGGQGTPEMRIPPLILGSFFVPIGIFWYGWSAEAKIHWIMPIIGTTIFGFGLMLNSIPIQLYLVDSFTYAASSIAAASTFRSLLGFAFPLFGQQLYAKLGIGGGNSLLAGLSIIIGIPFPILLWFHGAKMRSMSALTRHDESR